MYRWIDPLPAGIGFPGQTHRARLVTNEKVVIKVLKPGVRTLIERDTRLLRFFGGFCSLFPARYQPARILDEFSAYTLREVDLLMKPTTQRLSRRILKMSRRCVSRAYIGSAARGMSCDEYFRGIKPDETALKKLTAEQRRTAIDLGIGAIVRMIYRDGFFHPVPAPGELDGFQKSKNQRNQRRVHRPGDGRQVHAGYAQKPVLLFLLPGHGRSGERSPLPDLTDHPWQRRGHRWLPAGSLLMDTRWLTTPNIKIFRWPR